MAKNKNSLPPTILLEFSTSRRRRIERAARICEVTPQQLIWNLIDANVDGILDAKSKSYIVPITPRQDRIIEENAKECGVSPERYVYNIASICWKDDICQKRSAPKRG